MDALITCTIFVMLIGILMAGAQVARPPTLQTVPAYTHRSRQVR